MGEKLPQRKHTRLKSYDYSRPGAYFVTVCTHNRRCILSKITGYQQNYPNKAEITLLPYGIIAAQQLFALEKRYPYVKLDSYVIMPNHIHAIVRIKSTIEEYADKKDLFDIIGAYKSLTARACNSLYPIDNLFQVSLYDHVIRNSDDYHRIREYIYNNPHTWLLDEMYSN